MSSGDFTCQICCQNYDEKTRIPRIIPMCGHTICSGCIPRIIDQNYLVFKCPFDKKVCEVKSKDSEMFPKNFELVRLIEQKYIARPMTSPRDYNKVLTTCLTHDKDLELICVNDKAKVCMICAVKDHKGHDIILESEFDDEVKKKETALTQYTEGITKIEQQYMMVLENSATVEKIFQINSIEEQFRNLVQGIMELKEKIIMRATKEITEEKERIKRDILSQFTSIYSDSNLAQVNQKIKNILREKTRQNSFRMGCEILEFQKTLPEVHYWCFNSPKLNKNVPQFSFDNVYKALGELTQKFCSKDSWTENDSKVYIQHLYSCAEVHFDGDPLIGEILGKTLEKLELKNLMPYTLHYNGQELKTDKHLSDYVIQRGSYLKLY